MATAPRATWWRTSKLGPANEVLRGVALANDQWIFVGYDSGSPRIYTIPSASFGDVPASYTARTPNGTDPLYGVDYASAEDIACAVGDNGRIETTLNRGASWVSLSVSGSPDLRDVVAVTGSTTALMVAVGDSAIWGRDNTGVWTGRWGLSQYWYSVAYRSGVGWVTVGANGNGSHSATAANGSWLAPYSIDTSILHVVRGNSSYYIAGGTGGKIFRSTTGLSASWTRHQLDTSSDIGAITPLAADNVWALLTYTGEIFYSVNNGMTWTKQDYVISGDVWSMDVGNNMGGAVGDYGAIYYSDNQVQEDHIPVAAPTPPPAFTENDDMAGDAVARLSTQFRD